DSAVRQLIGSSNLRPQPVSRFAISATPEHPSRGAGGRQAVLGGTVAPGAERTPSARQQGFAALEEPHIGPALGYLQPAAFDRVLDPCAELLAAGFELVEKRRVDLLDMDAAVLDGFDAGGQFDELARCGFRIGEGTFGGELHAADAPRWLGYWA